MPESSRKYKTQVPPSNPWSVPVGDLAEVLGTDPQKGLSSKEVALRLKQYGPNRLGKFRKKSTLRILLDQFKSLIAGLLGVASLLSFLFSKWLEGIAILLALLLNTIIGFAIELKATRSMEALHKLGKTMAKTRRNGKTVEIPDQKLVPGDVVILEAGDLVPADLRLIEANNLQADESALTGESVPVTKREEKLGEDIPLAERSNMLFKGTSVTAGSGEGLVTATARNTEVGNIADLTQAAGEEEETPLEKRLTGLGRRLIWATAAIALLVAGAGLTGGKDLLPVIETAIAMAVAAVPEGLPIVATIAMARGVWRMAERNALVNRLSSVETLGATSVICTDKTGTLTENRLTVSRVRLQSLTMDFTSEGEATELQAGDKKMPPDRLSLLRQALEIGVLCNNASLAAEEEEQPVGDPLEISLLMAGRAAGMERKKLLEKLPEVREIAFSSETNMMATCHQEEGRFLVAVKGAPEQVLEACTRIAGDNGTIPLDENRKQQWRRWNDEMAADGLRMLAVALKRVDSMEAEPYEDLQLVGLIGFIDPPRREIAAIIEKCRQAGIKVVMVTGDHAATAKSVARAIGLAGEGENLRAATGGELQGAERLSEEERRKLIDDAVFARVDPGQKLNLITIHQQAGSVVAMTGDGVNDAPALKKADIGVAMGKRGTQVAREAADMVLKDDRFSTIMEAVEQGRIIFHNIRQFIIYLLSGNVSEVLIISLAGLVGAPLPLLPLQILYINLIGDVFPALGLGLGKGYEAVMLRPPRDPKEPILTGRHWLAVIGWSILIAVAVLGAFSLALTVFGMSNKEAISISFISLVLARLWHVFNMRDKDSGLLINEITTNPYIWYALAIGAILLLLALYLPLLATILQVQTPDRRGLLLILAAGLTPLIAGQGIKIVTHQKKIKKS